MHCSSQTETLREAFGWKVGRLTLAFPLPPAAGLNSHWQVSRPGLPALRGLLPLWPHLEAMAGSRSGLESSWPRPQPSPALPSPPFHVLFLNFLRMISTPGFLVFLLKPQSYSFSFNDSGKNSARALEDSGVSRMKRTRLCLPEHWFGFSLIESLRLHDKQGHSFSFFPLCEWGHPQVPDAPRQEQGKAEPCNLVSEPVVSAHSGLTSQGQC